MSSHLITNPTDTQIANAIIEPGSAPGWYVDSKLASYQTRIGAIQGEEQNLKELRFKLIQMHGKAAVEGVRIEIQNQTVHYIDFLDNRYIAYGVAAKANKSIIDTGIARDQTYPRSISLKQFAALRIKRSPGERTAYQTEAGFQTLNFESAFKRQIRITEQLIEEVQEDYRKMFGGKEIPIGFHASGMKTPLYNAEKKVHLTIDGLRKDLGLLPSKIINDKTKFSKLGEPKMATTTTTTTEAMVKVHAMSREHAKSMATLLAGVSSAQVTAVNTVKAAVAAKTCTTDDFPVQGARKWVTQYCVYSYGQKVPVGAGQYMYTDMILRAEGIDQKTDAVKKARELAIDLQMPMTVKIVKVLEDGKNTVTDVEPKSKVGQFSVSYFETN